MKTFQQFCENAYQLDEFRIGNPLDNPTIKRITQNPQVQRAARSLNTGAKWVARASYAMDVLDPKKNPLEKAVSAYGVVKPFSPTTYAPAVFKQGRTGSIIDRTARAIPGMTPDPNRDVGRRLGTAISSTASEILSPATASGKVKVGTDRSGKPIYMDK